VLRFVELLRSARVVVWPGAAGLVLALMPVAARSAEVNGDAAQQPASPMSLQAAQAAATAPPDTASAEPDSPFYKLDWSLALRGAYINDSSTGTRYEALALPSVTLTHTGSDESFHVTADGQLSQTNGGNYNIDQARLSAGSALQFTEDSTLTSNASLQMTQEDVNSPDVASDVAATPVETSGTIDSTFKQKFGRFNVSVSGNAERDIYGPTALKDGTSEDNTSQNNTQIGGGLRLGFELTPIVEAFTTANVTRTMFDEASPTFGTSLNGNLYTVMAGATAKWDETLTASVSAGVGLEHFDDPTLADVTSTLYDANLTYKPTTTLTLNGDLKTTIAPPGPNGSGTAQVGYAATADATYLVNDWLDWRGSAGWHNTTYADSTSTDRGYTLGLGADYLLNTHAKVTADYNFEHSEVTPNPPDDTHTVTLGMTFQK